MRCLVLLLLACASFAAPSVRWIDRLGDVHRQELKAVVAESAKEVTVETTEGKVVTVPVLRILTLVRESDRSEAERALLRAREDVAAGLRLDQARPVLDRLAATAAQPWVQEYAAAARAVLAERAGEKDAQQRIDRFLTQHEDSRFLGAVYVAAARLRARNPDRKEPFEIVFAKAYEKVEKLQGPLLVRFGAAVELVRTALVIDPKNIDLHMELAAGLLKAKTRDAKDMAVHVVAKSCDSWIKLAHMIDTAKQVTALGRKPHGSLVKVGRLCKWSGHTLPETRSDLHRELGLLKLACGDPAGARPEFEKARNLAPDRVRREAAEGALARLE
jgi:Flp pilus assembly protein TadD